MPEPTRAKSNPATQTRSVFISYARNDGAETANALRNLLKDSFDVWQDVERISGGHSWSKEIEAGLNACDVLLAVLTPQSFISDICRAEQIWALDEGKRVIPVLAAANAPIPVYLKTLIYREYPIQTVDLLADLSLAAPQYIPRPLPYYTIPSLPQNFVARKKALSGLRDLVLTDGADGNVSVTALTGMGGIGKTALAAALCRDEVVQRAFPDGIAWITIGREYDGDLVVRMREVARAVGDDLSRYDSKLACENRYRAFLREKAVLVVVDDVWHLEHLNSLLIPAPRSRFLFTTRESGFARAKAAREYPVDLLTNAEARNLLGRWSGPLPPEADQIIRECGNLAIAVSQIGACLRGASPAEWRDVLQSLKTAAISAIEDRLPTGQVSFFKSLAVSVEAIPLVWQERYLKLAVLLEDFRAPLAVLQTLWNISEAEALRTARFFVERSLATFEAQADLSRGILLHDLQLDYVRARFKDQSALRLIHGALRLSANVATFRPEEFASQMVSRLLSYKGERIAEFIGDISNGAPRPWFKPLWPSLHPPGAALIRTLEGHSGSVSAAAVTNDGQRAVSASWDHTLKIWDLDSGRQLRTLAGHSNAVLAVAVTTSGRRAVSASGDYTLKIWDLDSGQELRTLIGHSSFVTAVALTIDGERIISASGDCSLKIWDLDSGQLLNTLAGHSSAIWAVALTADGQRAVSASQDRTLKVWDLNFGRELCTLEGHSEGVLAVAVSSEGRHIVSASGDKTLKAWDLDSGQELRSLEGHLDKVAGVALRDHGRGAVSASSDKTLKVWDLDSGAELRSLEGHSSAVTAVAVTLDGRRAVSASDDQTLKVWDLDSSHGPCPLPSHSKRVVAVALFTDGRRALSASDDDTLKVWDLKTGKAINTLLCPSLSFSALALTADGRQAVSAARDSSLVIWDTSSGRQIRALARHPAFVQALAITADGGYAVSVSSDNTMRLWDMKSGDEIRAYACNSESVTAVAITGDGRRVVSASSDKTLKIWDLDSGQTLRVLPGPLSFVHALALTATGRRALTASDDNALTLWDLASGSAIASFTCDSSATCCAFAAPDEILAGDEGGRVYLLKLEEEL